MKTDDKRQSMTSYLLVHLILMVYSLGGICAKLASGHPFLSFHFFLYYGLVLLDLVFYAIMWQQVLKRMPLITAYANKAVTVIWGLVWGLLVFGETIDIKKIIGAMIIIAGIVMVVKSDEV